REAKGHTLKTRCVNLKRLFPMNCGLNLHASQTGKEQSLRDRNTGVGWSWNWFTNTSTRTLQNGLKRMLQHRAMGRTIINGFPGSTASGNWWSTSGFSLE